MGIVLDPQKCLHKIRENLKYSWGSWSIWLASIYFIIVVLVEWVWCAKAIKAITLLHLGCNLHE